MFVHGELKDMIHFVAIKCWGLEEGCLHEGCYTFSSNNFCGLGLFDFEMTLVLAFSYVK